MGISYRDAGVDIDRGEEFVRLIKSKLGDRGSRLGLFGGFFELAPLGLKEPVLVAGTDGVGTKLLLAKQTGIYHTIGIDLVAMCVNDVITAGARPLFFLDYLAAARLDLDKAGGVMDGIIEGCRQADCVLLGGETAEMPGVYAPGDYELAGFCVGAAEKRRLITGREIHQGDLILGLPSSGIHANGLSLARKVLFEHRRYRPDQVLPGLERGLGEELMVPTRIYARLVTDLVERFPVRGIAHITGGGLAGNIARLLRPGLLPRIHWDRISPQPVFRIIQEAGAVDEEEMRRTFNMGVGMALVCAPEKAQGAADFLRERGERCMIIGEVEEGAGA